MLFHLYLGFNEFPLQASPAYPEIQKGTGGLWPVEGIILDIDSTQHILLGPSSIGHLSIRVLFVQAFPPVH